METEFKQHCIVEIMGHQQIAGLVSEQVIAGTAFVRVDVPATSMRAGYTKFYGGAAIYSITPVEASVAQAMAEGLNQPPIEVWRLKSIDPSHQIAEPGHEDDWSDDFDEEDEDDDGPEPHSALSDKALAAQWARDLLAGEFVIFDTETTGFDAGDEIIQIGIIDQAGEVVLERLIRPVRPVDNTEYHGITNEMLINAPDFPEVHGQIARSLNGKRIVAYNISYDRRMLDQVCRRHGLDPITPSGTDCAMEQFAAFNGEWNAYRGNYRWKKLREALAIFGLKHEDFGLKEHDATTDARATLALIKKMAEYASRHDGGPLEQELEPTGNPGEVSSSPPF